MDFDHSEYIKAVLKTVNVELIKAKKLRILFDPVNGCAVEVGRELFTRLGEVVMINDRLGQRPNRASEPRRESLTETAKQVVKNHCDLGIATDVDADRVLFIDETGEVLSEDLTAAIFGSYTKLISGRERVLYVTPVNSSGLFKNEMIKLGVKVIECRVGPPEIIAAIKKHQADFAYEESGKYFFTDFCLWADGLLAGAKMLEILAHKNLSLSQIGKQYPEYFQVKLAIECPWEKMPRRWIGEGEKQIYDNSFMFIRASGTEPLIRIFSDSPSLERAKELAEAGRKIVEEELSK